jgi:hypothetical protein
VAARRAASWALRLGRSGSLQENSELREGTLQGDGARDEEEKRLRALAFTLQGDLQLKERALGIAESTASWWRTWSLRILLIGLVTRNLSNFPKLISALLAKRWGHAAHWLLHIIIWPIRPKASS